MYDHDEKLNEIINFDKIDMGLAMNILFNSISVNWDNFNDVDKFLIGKAFQTIQYYADKKEDIVISFNPSE
jgi:hypothetical protein